MNYQDHINNISKAVNSPHLLGVERKDFISSFVELDKSFNHKLSKESLTLMNNKIAEYMRLRKEMVRAKKAYSQAKTLGNYFLCGCLCKVYRELAMKKAMLNKETLWNKMLDTEGDVAQAKKDFSKARITTYNRWLLIPENKEISQRKHRQMKAMHEVLNASDIELLTAINEARINI